MKLSEKEQAVIEKVRLLETLTEKPNLIDHYRAFAVCLKTQGTLALFEQQGMKAISLNTFKKTTNELVDGGFDYVDELRQTLYVRFRQNHCATIDDLKPDTVRALKSKNKTLEIRCQSLEEDLHVATLSLKRALDYQTFLVNRLGGEVDRAACRKQRSEILALFAFSISSRQALSHFDNVVEFPDVEKDK